MPSGLKPRGNLRSGGGAVSSFLSSGSAKKAAEVARVADAAVVGSALVSAIEDGLDAAGGATPACCDNVLALVRALREGVRAARQEAAS